MKILRVLRIDLDLQKLLPAGKKTTRKIKRRKKLTPFSQIKNFACNRLLPLGRYTLDLNKNITMIFHLKKQLELSRVKQFSTLDWLEWVIWRNAKTRIVQQSPIMFLWRFGGGLHRDNFNSWNFNWTRECYYYRLSLSQCVTVGHSFAFLITGRSRLGLKVAFYIFHLKFPLYT